MEEKRGNKGTALCLGVSESDADELLRGHMDDLSGAVRARLKELDMTQGELARRMGVHPPAITHILRAEESVTLRTVARLEAALGIDLCTGFKDPHVL